MLWNLIRVILNQLRYYLPIDKRLLLKLVASIVIYAGITSLVESVKKVLHPEKAEYSLVTFIIILVAIVAKIILGEFVKKQGKKYNSGALVASGSEAMLDAIVSVTVFASALIYIFTNISLEAYVGIIISVIIIKAGFEMMSETVDDILGKRSDREEILKIKQVICEEEKVRGAYDLFLYNYGPDKNYGSVHIELPDSLTVDDVDTISRRIQDRVYAKTGVILTGVGVYSYNTSDDTAARIRNEVQKIVKAHEWALQMHGFYINTEKKTIRFDLVLSFDVNKTEAINILNDELKTQYTDYTFFITPDIDV